MANKIKTGISYFGNRNPRHFVSDLEEILSHNCSFILHTFSENDQQFYKDTMAELISLSKDAGLECYLDPWGIGRVFGGEAYSSFALNNREDCQVLPDGQPAPAACLNSIKFRDFMHRWIEDASDVGAEVLFWDEPHFFINFNEVNKYTSWYCCCNSCAERFHNQFQKSISVATSDEIIQFKENSLVDFLAELCSDTHSKGMKNAVCLLPFTDVSFGLSDWSKVASISDIDILGTDPYWMFFNKDLHKFVGECSQEIKNVCQKNNTEEQIWIQAFNIQAGRENELKEAIAVAYAEGIRNFAAWSYYGSEYMSYIRSANPQKAWDILGEVYGELQRGEWD